MDITYCKEKIYQHLSGMKCPVCKKDKHKLYIGAVSFSDKTVALFCTDCGIRIAISLMVVEEPKEANGK